MLLEDGLEKNCWVKYSSAPPGGGSRGARPGGPIGGSNSRDALHFHDNDQIFYVLEGEMSFEIEGERIKAIPGNLVIVPAGLAHRNWNSGTKDNAFISIEAPAPDPSKKHYPA